MMEMGSKLVLITPEIILFVGSVFVAVVAPLALPRRRRGGPHRPFAGMACLAK